MCGIAGYFTKSTDVAAPVGEVMMEMLTALECRGPDSAGVALYNTSSTNDSILQIKLSDDKPTRAVLDGVIANISQLSKPTAITTTGVYLRLAIDGSLDPATVISVIESVDSRVEVVSMGKRLEIIKQTGSPKRIDVDFHVSDFQGSHAIGHTRMSTESQVDLSHSQPFWAHSLDEIAIVHNGHITNYHKLRRQYEQQNIHFYTENDSEIIAVYVARGMSNGLSLEEVLEAALVDLDGSFSCLVSTASAMGFVKDPFAHKPLLFSETDEFVAVATEEIAFRPLIENDLNIREAGAREIRVWQN
tara:strand:- start:1075 stop:1983 length:909 start_codon:yes stop_codon:yes gene_type:complete